MEKDPLLVQVIRARFTELVEHIQPKCICGLLYEREALQVTDFTDILDYGETRETTERFLLKIIPKKCTYEIFKEVLSYDYEFLIPGLEQALEKIKVTAEKKSAPEKPINVDINTEARLEAVKGCHKVKRLRWNSYKSDFHDFLPKLKKARKKIKAATKKKSGPEKPINVDINTEARLEAVKKYYSVKRLHWNGYKSDFDDFLMSTRLIYENTLKSMSNCMPSHPGILYDSLNQSLQNISDLYFKSLVLKSRHEMGNAQCENQTSTCDLSCSQQAIFSNLEEVLYDTSVPLLYSMSCVGQRALVMQTSGNLDKALRIVYTAKQKGILIPNCREKVSPLSIESNTEWDKSIRKGEIDEREKCRLIGMVRDSRTANRELGDSNKEVEDFERATYIVEASIRLGISHKGKNIQQTITPKDIEEADACFKHIELKHNWKNLTERWRVVYFLGKAKIAAFQQKRDTANYYVRLAGEHASKIDYITDMKENVDGFKLEPMCED